MNLRDDWECDCGHIETRDGDNCSECGAQRP